MKVSHELKQERIKILVLKQIDLKNRTFVCSNLSDQEIIAPYYMSYFLFGHMFQCNCFFHLSFSSKWGDWPQILGFLKYTQTCIHLNGSFYEKFWQNKNVWSVTKLFTETTWPIVIVNTAIQNLWVHKERQLKSELWKYFLIYFSWWICEQFSPFQVLPFIDFRNSFSEVSRAWTNVYSHWNVILK